MAIPAPINIGWKQIVRDYVVIQGNYGIVSLTLKALQQNGLPYSTYNGFTGKFTLYNLSNKVIVTLPTDSISIIPNATDHELQVNITFTSVITLNLPPDSDLIGDLAITAPDMLEKQYPFRMNLRVVRSYTR